MRNRLKALVVGCALTVGSLGMAHADDELQMTVYKTPWCGCCKVWAEAMVKAGYTVETKDLDDLNMTKRQAGVPTSLTACHTPSLENM